MGGGMIEAKMAHEKNLEKQKVTGQGLVKAWIIATISEEALGTVVCLTTSCNVWKALSSAYLQNSQAREFELLVKLQEKKTDSTSLNDYIKEFKSTCDRFNAIGKPVPNQNKVEAGHTILIHTVAAGVGYLLYQWANALGATVIGTVSTEEKATQAKEDGSHHIIIYTHEDFVAMVNTITSGKRVDVVYD
ncbi:hypothetical protein IFM89_019894 [Coptis chinensis]|uniref:Alcohol dehydrogenase-like C-terminal domain-containing protein n=1 Tax=Coptis chinensis TaxID=261450 RepID=A0A835I3W6_9MAGN|nr:hypothetical protein IFM89_019894 [Coptis chinensis]